MPTFDERTLARDALARTLLEAETILLKLADVQSHMAEALATLHRVVDETQADVAKTEAFRRSLAERDT